MTEEEFRRRVKKTVDKWKQSDSRFGNWFRFGKELFGHEPDLSEQSKMHELVNNPRIKPGIPRSCITPTGRRNCHGVYRISMNDILVCAFCKEPI